MNRVSAIFSHISKSLKQSFNRALEPAADVYAALINPAAMNAHDRRLDEFKLVAGGAISGAGMIEANPLVIAGGTIPAWEAFHDLQRAGHLYRNTHRHFKKLHP
jgi:hypothetical protein